MEDIDAIRVPTAFVMTTMRELEPASLRIYLILLAESPDFGVPFSLTLGSLAAVAGMTTRAVRGAVASLECARLVERVAKAGAPNFYRVLAPK
jgi:hypothetical protein